MHILFVSYEFVTEKKPCGGFGNYLANISTILAENSHKVTILVISNHNSAVEWKNNITVITFHYHYQSHAFHFEDYLEALLPINNVVYFNYGMALRKKIQEIHRNTPIDLIQYNGDRLEIYYRIPNIPSVVRLSSFNAWYRHAYKPNSNMDDYSWMKTWDAKIFLHSLNKADAVFGPSQCVANFVNLKSHKKVQVIESPYMLQELGVQEENIEILRNKKYLLFFGRICILKGINTVIDSIYQILEENLDIVFAFAGNVEEKGNIEKLFNAAKQYKDRVIYLGDIRDREKLRLVISYAEACVLPSRADNLPNACIEAMGMGKIVIGTYGASFEQMIEDKKSGLLIKRDCPNDLVEAIRFLIKMTPEEKDKMGHYARQRIEQMNPEKIYAELIEFYKKVCNKNKYVKKE